MEKFEYSVFIGRFSPFQKAHQVLLQRALDIAEKVIVVIGSSNTARTIKNPWSAIERQQMISQTLSPEQLQQVIFVHMGDYLYNDNLWISTLQSKIDEATDYSESVAMVGYDGDETSYYLKLFPQYHFVSCKTDYQFHTTQVRDLYFSMDNAYKELVPASIIDYLEDFKKTSNFKYVKEEYDYICQYKESWRGAPYAVIFQTVDCLVVKSGHILVVSRKFNPGKGLLALPGGFVNPNELLQDAAFRELKEETGIKINVGDLKRAIVETHLFDAVHRSARGRTLTNAYLINLGMGPLPQIKANDDAAECMWLPLSDFYSMSDQFFEDHWAIICFFVSKF